ncbi:MAG: hypothetical protein ACTSPB_26510 [Candidatus Thorarchaeota archaeon]
MLKVVKKDGVCYVLDENNSVLKSGVDDAGIIQWAIDHCDVIEITQPINLVTREIIEGKR